MDKAINSYRMAKYDPRECKRRQQLQFAHIFFEFSRRAIEMKLNWLDFSPISQEKFESFHAYIGLFSRIYSFIV